ncbi:MAG: diacylglycerol kinase family protein [Candidatus Pacebacteria bacterium]|nr:diacylglycerol kinase family protein [Candidatus Paceibacterota bacterium]
MKNYHSGFGPKGVLRSAKNSLRGFRVLMRNEYNLYIQLFFAAIAIAFGFVFEISLTEWAIQIAVIGLVIFSELVNTAIEKTMDLVHPNYDERVRDIKDLASGSVLFMVIVSIAAGLLIYIPKVF